MSHFAEIDANGIVIQVLVGDNSFTNEGYDWFVENLGGTWIKTSYNANIRGKFAAIGDTYDSKKNLFVNNTSAITIATNSINPPPLLNGFDEFGAPIE